MRASRLLRRRRGELWPIGCLSQFFRTRVSRRHYSGPSRPASLGRAIPSPRGAWAASPALAYLHLALCSLYCSPGFLGTVPTYLVPTCIFYLPDSRSTYSPTHTGHISLPPIHLLPPPQLSAVGRLLLFRRKEGGHHCYRHVLIRNREGKVDTT